MKKKLLLMLFLVFYNVISLRGQGLCENATQISGTSVIPGSLVISTFTDKGYNLGCANAYGLAMNVGQQRPTWLYCVVGQPGTINMNFTNSANNDVDWVVWGPFAPNRTIANICSSDMDLLPPVFCDVLPSPNAVGSITPTLAGQIYIIMVTNYTGTPTNCSLAFSGTGSFGLAPSIACPSNITVSNTAGQCGANVSFSATETVGIPASAITYSPASGSFFPVGTTTVTATATNSIGSSSCSFTVTVNDTEAPAILPSVPSPVTLNYADRMITYTGVSINGGGTSRSVAPGSPVSLAYGMSVSFNYSTGYCPGCVVQSYVGIGGTNQTLQCEQYISNGYSVNRSVNFTAPVAPGIYYITQNGSLDYQCNLTSFDNAAANAIGVIVVGSASVCPANITVNATAGQCGANVSWAAPVASDNCGIQSFVSSPISGANFPIGTTPVTYTATDAAGNTTSCSFTVTVVDNQPPVLTCSGPVSLQCPGAFELTPPTITDNCGVGLTNGPIISTNGSFSSGGASWNMCGNSVESLPETFYGGSDGSNMTAEIDHQPVTLCQNINGFIVGQTYQLTFRASRRTGAPATVGAIVTIDGGALNTTVLRSNGPFSLTAETFSFVATQATHQLKFVPSGGWGGTVGFIVDDIAVRGQFVSVNNAPASFPYGNTTVTWTATDVNGNTATCDQIVSVVDTQAPVFASPLTANSYVFSTTTGVALEDLSAGATTIFGSGVDDASVTSVLPFTFNYKSINFTNLGVSSNGVLIPNGNTSNYINNTNDAGMTNALFPFWDDLVTGSDGSVRTKVVGTAPNRKFVVEWKDNLYVDGLSAFTTPYKITLQAWLFEGSNVIQYVYGNNTGAVNFSGTIGLKGSNASDFNEVTTLHGSSTSSINDNYNLWPGNGRSYVFTPNGCPADILVNADAGQCGANVSFAAIVTDNCGTPTVTYSPASGSFFAIGTTPVTVTATDASGNSTTCSFTVTVDLLNLVNLQWPPSATICQGGSLTAYGQVYEPGVTTLGYGIQGANIEAQFGYATSNTDPSTWSSWSPATFNALANWPDKNEYFIDFTPPTSGTFYYTFRFRQNGCAWQYGGYNVSGGGFWNGTTAVSGVLTVDPTTVGGSVSGGTSICPGFTSSELTLSGHTGSIARWESSVAPFITWDPIAVTITTYTSGALAETTRFRAVVQSGVCLSVASDYTEVEVYLTYPFYADTDSDGYGAGPVVILCSDSASNAPAGYSVDGTDCDDSDDTKHATFPFYVDADGDGYGAVGSASVQLCAVDGATPPEPNYSVNDDDCNDLVFAINPGVAEIAFDSIDNDCDGSLFNGLTPIVVNVLSPSCGGINHGLNNTINCTEIYLGEGYVIGYRFKVTNLATGEVDYVDTVQHHFKLTDTDIYSYGTAFSIQVAAIVNGEVQPYNGATCTLTTTTVATTKVVTAQCGSTLTYMYSTINANSVSSTNLYRFRIARVDAPTTYYLIERTVPNFNLTMVTGLPLTYATEYKVDVQIRVKLAGFTAWSQYGQVCSIFSPPFPTSSIVLSQCEMTATSNSQVIYATPYAGATTYRFLLTGYDGITGEVNYSQYQDSPTPSFTLSMFSGLTPGATYTVTVSMELYGSFVPYDKDCSITTPLPARELEPTKVTDVFKATAYPNPFANNFMIAVTSSSSSTVAIKVYDMVGRLVEQRDVKFAELANSTIGERYPSGVYNIVVTQDDTVEVVRVVKR